MTFATTLRLSGMAALLAGGPALADPFTILIYETPQQFALRTARTPEGQAYWKAFDGIGKAMAQAGVLKGGAALTGEAGVKSVLLRDGVKQVRDGALAAAPETLGGYFIIDVADVDAAVEWAARIPSAATGAIEVRPHYAVPGMAQ